MSGTFRLSGRRPQCLPDCMIRSQRLALKPPHPIIRLWATRLDPLTVITRPLPRGLGFASSEPIDCRYLNLGRVRHCTEGTVPDRPRISGSTSGSMPAHCHSIPKSCTKISGAEPHSRPQCASSRLHIDMGPIIVYSALIFRPITESFHGSIPES